MSQMYKNAPALPEAFIARLHGQLTDVGAFVTGADEEPLTSVRYHPRKLAKTSIEPLGSPVPWHTQGRYLDNRPKFNRDPLYHAGLYYPMEASSMLLGHMLKKVKLPQEALLLDLCAAPGGKSLILKDSFPDQFLLSNEIDGKRAHILKENVVRWGTENHLVVNSDAARLCRSGLRFDLVLIDAPCSGEGLFRKDKNSRTEWSPERAAGCAVRQAGILEDAIELLAPGGWLIYSTCTFNPEENIVRVQQLMESGLQIHEVDIPDEWGVETVRLGGAVGYQCWLHRVEGEGFFIALLKKEGERETYNFPSSKPQTVKLPNIGFDLSGEYLFEKWENTFIALTQAEYDVGRTLAGHAGMVKRGVMLGTEKGKDFIPAHDLATHPLAWGYPSKLELSLEAAIDYFRGNSLNIPATAGPVLLTFGGLGIGFGKSTGTRINNLFPKHLRVF